MGKAIKKVGSLGLAGATGGASLLVGGGGIKDLLLGKKKGGFSPDEIAAQIRGAQAQGIETSKKGLGELNQALDQDVGAGVRSAAAKEQKGILSAAQDARRRAQQSIAQRGLQGSSLGLAQDRSITQQTGEANAALQASLPERIRQMQLQNASTRLGAGQGLFSSLGGSQGVRFHGQDASRSGGVLGIASALAPLAGTVMGGAMGGPMGAQAGGAAGGAISNAFGGTKTQNRQMMSPNAY